MSKRHTNAFDFGSATDGWIAVEPTDVDAFERAYKKTVREGEERLMLAVFEDAVQCFQEYVLSTQPREKRLFQEAEEWFLDKNGDYIFSFEFICESLGLHPEQIRRGLMTWKDAKQKIGSLQRESRRPGKLVRTRHIPRPGRLAKRG
ncbi:MAG: hypothetical protein WCH75_14335 [Candidatus Binatia bacterium]|jgi:hypothetical protein